MYMHNKHAFNCAYHADLGTGTGYDSLPHTQEDAKMSSPLHNCEAAIRQQQHLTACTLCILRQILQKTTDVSGVLYRRKGGHMHEATLK